MTKFQITKDFIVKTVMPVLFAVFLYSMFINLCRAKGTVDYTKLFILCGIPFGITKMFVFPIGCGTYGLAMLIFSIAAGGVIGGIILIWRLIVALWYVPLTAVRFIAAKA